MALMEHSDWTEEEMAERRLGFIPASFQHYSSGIYSDRLCKWGRLNHAVLLVGYNKDTEGEHYWIVKNSWGTGWGQGGYIHMKMGENSCGLAKSPMYPLM